MRLIGQLHSESHARLFGEYLYARDFENSVEEEEGHWAIWVHDESKLEAASTLLKEFQQQPDHPSYAKEARRAASKRDQVIREEEAARKRTFDRTNIFPTGAAAIGKVTLSLIGASLLVTLITGFGGNSLFSVFSIVPIEFRGDNRIAYTPGFEALLNWQIWRLLTPMFIHMGFLHLLFNLWWTKDLGSALERQLGRGHFLLLVVLIAIPSHIAQFLATGPMFGGLSGVVYGLLGYIWVRSKLDPFWGLALNPSTVMIMAVWFLLCFTGTVGPIANVVHGVGLGIGALAGAISARRG
ncbi:MAG: Rhomboid protease GlpG [Verrucomicrobiota bacterium]|jgi:GlpG protein